MQQRNFHHIAGDSHLVSFLVCHVAYCLHIAHGQVRWQIDIARGRSLIYDDFLRTVCDAVRICHLHAVHLVGLNGIGNHRLADVLLVEGQHGCHQHDADRGRVGDGELAK